MCLLGVVANASFDAQSIIPALKSSLGRVLQDRLETSQSLAMLEQEVEDVNALLVASAPDAVTACSKRRLICLPLDERFDPPMGVFSHGHVQTGDKMSVPRVFWQAIQLSQAEVRLKSVSHVVCLEGCLHVCFFCHYYHML
jgi:hypothetical protein